ncbi:Cytoplasmic dynein 1 intermediate chain 2 [Sarracenia purpurea var. burkii]
MLKPLDITSTFKLQNGDCMVLLFSFVSEDEYNLNPGLEWEDEFTAEDEESSLPTIGGYQSKLPPGILPHGLPQVKEVQPACTSLETQENKKEEPKPVRELSEEEKNDDRVIQRFSKFYGSMWAYYGESSFRKFHPNLILGGTYSGQIVLWDNRVQKRTPVQRTPLSATAHTHPVYCLKVVGTQNAHNLISVSTDGRLCSWSLDMLSQPQETLELQHKQAKPIAVTSFTFPYNDVNNFVLGSEEGIVYSACRHGNKAGVLDMYEGHHAPVTGIDAHMVQTGISFNHLFLTSSFDWTIKLWNIKETKPLYSFDYNGDTVMDVAWSPVHPAVFAAVDIQGKVDVWDLNTDTEIPIVSTQIDGNSAINQVSWTPSGTHITVGDETGRIWLYDVGEQIAHPRHDEASKLVHTLQEFKNNQTDEEIDKTPTTFSSGPSSLSSLTSR